MITLIQCASGRYVDLQLAVTPHHAAYCRKHGISYLVHIGKVQNRFGPMWDKVILVKQALARSQFVVWMDTDSLIVDPSVSLMEAFMDVHNVGHVRHPEKWKNYDGHFNCGVGFYVLSPATISYLDKVWSKGPIPHPTWQVQATMMEIGLRDRYFFSRVDDKWNATVKTNMVEKPVIESWHGHNQDFAPILARLKQVSLV